MRYGKSTHKRSRIGYTNTHGGKHKSGTRQTKRKVSR